MTDVEFIQVRDPGPSVECTTTHASTDLDDDDDRYNGIVYDWTIETPLTEAERVEAKMNRDPYCERFMRGE